MCFDLMTVLYGCIEHKIELRRKKSKTMKNQSEQRNKRKEKKQKQKEKKRKSSEWNTRKTIILSIEIEVKRFRCVAGYLATSI